MTYAQGEADILSLLQALAEWDSTNSLSLANDATNLGAAMLSGGASDHYLFLSPGEFESGYENIADTLVIHRWQTLVTLCVFLPAPEANAAEMRLAAYRDNAIAALDARLHLNSSTVDFAKVIRGREIANFSLSDKQAFISQELTLLWEEVKNITQSD